MASPPALQTKKPCHSHLLMLPWVQTQVRDLSLIFDLTLGSALHPLMSSRTPGPEHAASMFSPFPASHFLNFSFPLLSLLLRFSLIQYPS